MSDKQTTKRTRCGKPSLNRDFIDCNEPDATTMHGVLCKTCGVEVSAEAWERENAEKEAARQ